MPENIIKFPLRGKFLDEKRKFEQNKKNNISLLKETINSAFIKTIELNKNIYTYVKDNPFSSNEFPEEDLKKTYNLNNEQFDYIKTFIKYFDTIHIRVLDLFYHSHKLIDESHWLSGLTVLRSLIEALWFSNFVSQKSYAYISNGNYDEFFKIFIRSNFYQKTNNLKKKIIREENISTRINTESKKGYNVLTLAEFYNKTDFIKLVENFNVPTFLNLDENKRENKKKIINESLWFESIRKTTLEILKTTPKLDLEAYKYLCDLVHPNAVYYNNPNDEINIIDYKYIYCAAMNQALIILVKFNNQTQLKILEILMKNVSNVIDLFKRNKLS